MDNLLRMLPELPLLSIKIGAGLLHNRVARVDRQARSKRCALHLQVEGSVRITRGDWHPDLVVTTPERTLADGDPVRSSTGILAEYNIQLLSRILKGSHIASCNRREQNPLGIHSQASRMGNQTLVVCLACQAVVS